MRIFSCAEGQSLQIGDITVKVLEVGDEEGILRIDCPDGVIVEAGNSDLVMQSERRLE